MIMFIIICGISSLAVFIVLLVYALARISSEAARKEEQELTDRLNAMFKDLEHKDE